MSETAFSFTSAGYKFFRDRLEWADVTPIKQDESPRGVVRIAYSDAFVDAHDYVRAVMAADERSPRVLELTSEALQMNAANYSIWAYRRNVLTTLKASLSAEHHFTKTLLYDHPKNYQLWYHLQWLMEQAAKTDGENDPKTVFSRPDSYLFSILSAELDLVHELLVEDAKNYHAWQYRRWLVDFFGIPTDHEVNFCDLMLADDALNNSAWNHRFYTIVNKKFNDVVFDREVKFVVGHLSSMPHNESACNYLLGLLFPLPPGACQNAINGASEQSEKSTLDRLLKVRHLIEDLVAQDVAGAADTPAILSLLVELLCTTLQKRQQSVESVTVEDEETRTARRAMEICERLALELDRVRANYWQYRRSQIEQLLTQSPMVA
ncbi:unnamed protein product [Mesocestoides corti]|nr:unnamed protein product [Mesocestoides corti]